MAVTDILARDHAHDWSINTGTSGSPVWVGIGGINKWSPSPKKNDADTTKFSDDGWMAHLPASRTVSITISGLVQMDPSDESRDPGQEAVEAQGQLLGTDGLAEYKYDGPGGGTYVVLASVNVTPGGGGNDDPSAWSAELTVTGKPTYTAP